MKKIIWVIFVLSLFALPAAGQAALADSLSGMILLQVEANGEAWYIYPSNNQRCYLGRPDDAFRIMRELGLGIKHAELEQYLNTSFPKRLSGKILLDVESHGEAYYVYPKDLKGYYLGRPNDAFQIMREKGLGITNTDLAKITVHPNYNVTISDSSSDSDNDTNNNTTCASGYHLLDGQCYTVTELEKVCQENYGPQSYYGAGDLCYCAEGYGMSINNYCVTYQEQCQEKYGPNSYSGFIDEEGNNICQCQEGYFWENGLGVEPNYCVQHTVTYVDTDSDGIYDDYDLHPDGGDKITTKVYYPYDYANQIEYKLQFNIAGDWLFYYENVAPHTFSEDFSNCTDYVTYYDPTVISIADTLYSLEEGDPDNVCLSCLVLDFVQRLDYISDFNTGYDEYPKYPSETLMDGTGDCEDFSFLMASILKALGYDVAILEYVDHVAVGVNIGDTSLEGTYFEHYGVNYYFLETTGQFDLGEVPDDLMGIRPNIFPIL